MKSNKKVCIHIILCTVASRIEMILLKMDNMHVCRIFWVICCLNFPLAFERFALILLLMAKL